jgi:assimilatory nitrate reductase catalytic subunit
VKFNPPLQLTNTTYPFVVNSGRARDQWHTMTRTGKATKLLAHMAEACVHIHPDDGKALGLSNGDLASLKSTSMENTTKSDDEDRLGGTGKNKTKDATTSKVIYPVKIDPSMRKGEVFIPIHWSGQWGSHSKLGALYASAVDAISGQPELKHAAASITPVSYDVYGSFLFGEQCDEYALKESVDFWTKTLVPTSDNSEAEVLNFAKNGKRADIAKALLTVLPQNTVQHQFHHNDYSVCIALKNDVLCFIAVLSDEPIIPKSECYMPSNWLASLLNNPLSLEKQCKLMRCEVDESFLNGSVVCSCFNVREKPINEAIKNGVNSVSELGLKLKCGTNCGSCKPALADMLSQSTSIKFQAN